MPNHIENILILHTNKIDFPKIIGNEDEDFSFKYIAPEPIFLNEDEYDWYGWRIQNWGTKWDAYDVNKLEKKTNEDGTLYFRYTFDTAWNPPYKWIEAIAKKCPNTNVELYWADEDLPQSGWFKIINNQLTEEFFSEDNLVNALNFLNEYFPDKYELYQEYRIGSDSESIEKNE